MRTEASEARRQRGRGARGHAGRVAEHGRGAGAQVDQVVLCGLVQHLQGKKDGNCRSCGATSSRLTSRRKKHIFSTGEKRKGRKIRVTLLFL